VGRDYVTTADLLSLGHARDGLDMTHGTHTLGTAAGSGYDSPYRGIAPESDIVLVANAVTDDLPYIDSADVYKYTFATDALGFKYIFDQADRMGKPCVISFSEGSGQDFWGYDQLYYEMLDSLTGPGHIIVSSAGNQGRTKSWFRKPAGEPSMGTFLYRAASEMTVTLKSADHFALRFVSYSQPRDTLLVYTRDVVMNEDSTLTVSVHNDADNRLLLVQLTAYPSCYDASETCYDAQILTTKHVGDTPKLSLEVVGTSADVEVFRSTGYFTENAINPALNAGECVRNINSPSSSPSVICVGATIYRTGITNYKGNWRSYETGSGGQRMTATSVGPTFDGRVKPDVMAPGANVISSYSSFYLEHHPTAADIGWDVAHFPFNGRTYAWNSNSGTSMAAPAVGGAIALWLQANPRLTPDDVLSIIGRTSRHNDPSLDYPNNEWGHGEIDVYRGLIDVLGLTAVEPLSVTQSKAHISISHGRLLALDLDAITSQPLRVRLYSLSGTLVADHQLQKGSSHYQVLLPPAIRGVIAVQLDGEAAIRGSQLIRVE
jgi:subtilisin family serine protease